MNFGGRHGKKFIFLGTHNRNDFEVNTHPRGVFFVENRFGSRGPTLNDII